MLPVINAIWIGPKLGPIHVACLRSFLRQGHRVVLHCYERPADTPADVEIADARNLLPESRIIRYRGTGSFALFSNLLRYEILKAGLGIYVDCDVYCLRPIEDAEYIFGREGILKGSSINNVVLKLPRDCPALAALCAIKDTRDFVPPWEKVRRRLLQWLRGPAAVTPLEDLPWGTTGPRALSFYAEKFGISRYASPVDRCSLGSLRASVRSWPFSQRTHNPSNGCGSPLQQQPDQAIATGHRLAQRLAYLGNGVRRVGCPLWVIIGLSARPITCPQLTQGGTSGIQQGLDISFALPRQAPGAEHRIAYAVATWFALVSALAMNGNAQSLPAKQLASSQQTMP